MSVQTVSILAQSCPTLCDPMNRSMPGLPVCHSSQNLLKLMSIKLVMPSKHHILCHPLFLLPSIFPIISILSSGSVLHIKWPNWRFSLSISPSNEYSGLIIFTIDWLDLLACLLVILIMKMIKVWKWTREMDNICEYIRDWNSFHWREWFMFLTSVFSKYQITGTSFLFFLILFYF